jgi:hypothetical protein
LLSAKRDFPFQAQWDEEIEFKLAGCIAFPQAHGRPETISDRTVAYIPLQITSSNIKVYR